MLSEGRRGPLREPYAPTLAALGGLEDAPALRLRERAAYLEHPGVEVHVFPLESQELAAPEPGGDGHDVEGLQPIPGFASGFKEGPGPAPGSGAASPLSGAEAALQARRRCEVSNRRRVLP